MEYWDYYAILGVPKDADEKAIKSACRALALKYHPDVSSSKAATDTKFKEITEAYEVLSDKERRQMIEAIGFKSSPPARAKDLFESFFRAASRLKDGAKKLAIALPLRAQAGLPARAG